MSSARNPGRRAGLLYLIMGLPAPFALLYVPGLLMVHGNAAATAHNIAANQTLLRLAIVGQLLSQTLFIFTVLALYNLLKGVDSWLASLMRILVLVSVPIAFLNEVNAIAALELARNADLLSAFPGPQRDALAMLFLKLRGEGLGVVQIFWGLWLFPLGLLVYRSGFIPRIFGALLIVNSFAYPAETLTFLFRPQWGHAVSQWMLLPQLGELWFILWLLIKGAIPKNATHATESVMTS